MPVATNFFEASCYDISANVHCLADNSGDDSVCPERHSALENLTSEKQILLSGYCVIA